MNYPSPGIQGTTYEYLPNGDVRVTTSGGWPDDPPTVEIHTPKRIGSGKRRYELIDGKCRVIELDERGCDRLDLEEQRYRDALKISALRSRIVGLYRALREAQDGVR